LCALNHAEAQISLQLTIACAFAHSKIKENFPPLFIQQVPYQVSAAPDGEPNFKWAPKWPERLEDSLYIKPLLPLLKILLKGVNFYNASTRPDI